MAVPPQELGLSLGKSGGDGGSHIGQAWFQFLSLVIIVYRLAAHFQSVADLSFLFVG